jgi:hypothetical protein
MYIPGLVIAALTALAFVVAFVLEVRRSRQLWPRYWVKTPTTKVGVRWFTNLPTWPGLERAVLAIEHVLYLRYGAETVKKKNLMGFWIDVYEKNEPMPSALGFAGRRRGNTITGAIERVSFYMGFSRRFVLQVRQLHKIKTKLPDGSTWQEGELLDAGSSALFHEVAEHYVPLMLKGNINAQHAEEWKLLTNEMRQAYKMLSIANGKAD